MTCHQDIRQDGSSRPNLDQIRMSRSLYGLKLKVPRSQEKNVIKLVVATSFGGFLVLNAHSRVVISHETP